MPIEYDRRPGSANKKQRKRDGTLPEPPKAPAPPEPVEKMRVRMLKRVAARIGTFEAGQSAALPVDLARSWIGSGLAEQDKALDSAPETK